MSLTPYLPLPQPVAYLVIYDLKQPRLKYAGLFAELQNSVNWFHFLDSSWIIVRNEPLVTLGPKLRGLIYTSDFIMVMPAKGPVDGWLPVEAWNWLNANLPREW